MDNGPTFWRWFFGDSSRPGGWRKFANRWLLLHVGVGVTLAWVGPLSLTDAATAVLLPLVGVLVGMSFAWAGNAQALLQASEMEVLLSHHDGGLEEYVYTYQMAVLTILVTMALWGVAGLGVIDRECVFACPAWGYGAAKTVLFTAASVTLRECWHVVLAAHWMLLAQRVVRKREAALRARRALPGTGARASAELAEGQLDRLKE